MSAKKTNHLASQSIQIEGTQTALSRKTITVCNYCSRDLNGVEPLFIATFPADTSEEII